jgi:NAD(P)H dehydrogenase (quinone)
LSILHVMQQTKNILIIIGHSSTKSLSHKLAHNYAKGAKESGHTVKIIDIYRMDPVLPIANYEDFPDWARDSEIRQHYQEMIKNADKIVVFHPIWWGGLPPLLKNFIDQTLTPGFAYKFTPKKWLPQSLNIKPDGFLKGKRAHVFITYDAYTIVYALMLFPFITIWAVFILSYCGITRMRFTLHQRVRWTGEPKREKWLARATKLGKKA